MLRTRIKITMTFVTFWKWQLCPSVLRKFTCDACVDIKPRDIEITCIISSDIGGLHISSYCEQHKALQCSTNEAIENLCAHIYEYTQQHSLNTYLEDICYRPFTRGKSYARNWAFAWTGHSFKNLYDLFYPISPRCTLDGNCHSPLVNYCRPVKSFSFHNLQESLQTTPKES